MYQIRQKLNILSFYLLLAHIGEVMKIIKCCKGYMELHFLQKKPLKGICIYWRKQKNVIIESLVRN